MLKPLLLLCWAAIFVSAGEQKDVITDHTSVPINPTGDSSATNPQSLNSKLPITSENTHVPSVQDGLSMSSSEFSDLHPKPTSTSTASTIHTSSTAVTPKPTTKPTTAPTTTTTSVPPPQPPTPAPTPPLPPPSTEKWKVEENNVVCIIVQMAAQFNVSYTNLYNTTTNVAMNIPSNGTVTGNCSKTEQNLTFSWELQEDMVDNFTLHFMKDKTEKLYSLHHLEIFVILEKRAGNKSADIITLVHLTPQYEITLGNSYRCLKEQKLALTLQGKNETIGHLKISNLQFQAFRNDNTTAFGLAKDCSFDTPDIVPITVGCALAGLVVIVLIAYLVGRRRSQARGYLSM